MRLFYPSVNPFKSQQSGKTHCEIRKVTRMANVLPTGGAYKAILSGGSLGFREEAVPRIFG